MLLALFFLNGKIYYIQIGDYIQSIKLKRKIKYCKTPSEKSTTPSIFLYHQRGSI